VAILPGLFSLLATSHNELFLSLVEIGSMMSQSGMSANALSALYSMSPDSLNEPKTTQIMNEVSTPLHPEMKPFRLIILSLSLLS